MGGEHRPVAEYNRHNWCSVRVTTRFGLLQGTVLSTTLFTLYIADLPHPLTPNWLYMQMMMPFYLNPGDLKPAHINNKALNKA